MDRRSPRSLGGGSWAASGSCEVRSSGFFPDGFFFKFQWRFNNEIGGSGLWAIGRWVIILRCFTRFAEFRGREGRLIRDLSCDDTPFRAPTKALTMRAVCMFSSSMLSKRQFVKLIGCNLSKCFQM